MGSEIQSRKEGWRRAVPGAKHERGKSKQEGQTQDPGSSGFGGRGYILGSVIERWIWRLWGLGRVLFPVRATGDGGPRASSKC